MSRRTAGPGSSPGLSTKQKTALWQKLRRLDALCEQHRVTPFERIASVISMVHSKQFAKKNALFKKYDEQRKLIRWKLKGILPRG